jgi:class 3 adenylate cyclase
MATFDGPQAAERAVRAASEAAQAIRQKRGAVEKQVGFFPNVSAGIHCGPVIAGPVGASVVRRLDYTVIGDVVNTAARLQHLASPGEVVLSAAVKRRLPDDFVVHERGVHSIRGKAEPVMLYCLRPGEQTRDDLLAIKPPDAADS